MNMTKTLEENGIVNVAPKGRNRVEVVVFDEDDDVDRAASEKQAHAAMDLIGCGGFVTSYGSWIIDCKATSPAGDYNDRASEHHR